MIRSSCSSRLKNPLTRMNLMDRFQRSITYLRLSITVRCNLRCRYCMPPEGIKSQPGDILSWEELSRLTDIFVKMGIRKLRITGGEPFLRKGLLNFLRRARSIPGLESIHVTTNGVDVAPLVPQLQEIGISGINLSLDTLRRHRFKEMTRRDYLNKVLVTLQALLKSSIPVKINMVVKKGFNDDEIFGMMQLARDHPVEVRFIEEMPFLGWDNQVSSGWDFQTLIELLRSRYKNMSPLPLTNATARCFVIPGFAGKIGIIAGNSRLFCSSCNRIRMTASGQLKTCLYGPGILNLKSMLRKGASPGEIQSAIKHGVWNRSMDGFEAWAERKGRTGESMAAIGG